MSRCSARQQADRVHWKSLFDRVQMVAKLLSIHLLNIHCKPPPRIYHERTKPLSLAESLAKSSSFEQKQIWSPASAAGGGMISGGVDRPAAGLGGSAIPMSRFN